MEGEGDMKKIQKIIVIFSIFCITLIGLNVKAEVIEISKPPEVTDLRIEGKGNVLSTTDSWKMSASVTNINPLDVDYCMIRWRGAGLPASNRYYYIDVKLYYNTVSGRFEGEYNNINILPQTTYAFPLFSITLKSGEKISPDRTYDTYYTEIIINNNCAKGTHKVYTDSWENNSFSYGDKSCPHKATQVRKCNICSQIADTRYLDSTISGWIMMKDLGIKVKKCYQCGAFVEQQSIPKNAAVFTASSGGYKVTSVGNTVEYQGSKSVKNAIVPETVSYDGITYKVTSIAPGAFKNNKKLTKVTIGSNVKTIGKQAFYGCKNLKSIIIKSKYLTTKSIGAKAFTKAGSKNYKKLVVKLPKSKKKAYVKLLEKKGLSSKAKIK